MGDSAYKKRHKELGLCLNCSEPAFGGYATCFEHWFTHRESTRKSSVKYAEKNRTRGLKERLRRVAEGDCQTCGNKLDPDADEGLKNCMNCRSRDYRRAIRCR